MSSVLEIYDPAMCCSTGVCGSDVDSTLVDFANDLKWLKSKGIEVKRFNLGHEPEAFKSNPEVLIRLKNEGSDILPIILVNHKVTSEGGYPNREQLCNWLGIDSNGSVKNLNTHLLQKLQESVCIGDSDMMSTYFNEGKESGIEIHILVDSMQHGLDERQALTHEIIATANDLLGIKQNCCTPGGGCC